MAGSSIKRFFIFFIVGLFFLLISQVNAAVSSPFVRGIRPLGMGGAFTAVADDYNALMYNPAGFANIKKQSFTLLQIDAGTDIKTLDTISWILNNQSRLTAGGTGGSLANWTQSDIDTIGKSRAKVSVNLNLLTLAVRNFGFGGFTKISTDIGFETGIFIPKANIDVSVDVIVPVSYARYITGLDEFFHENLGGGKLAVGGTVKLLARNSLTETRNALELTSINVNDYLKKAQDVKYGYGFDLGFLFDANETINSTFALVINDLYTSIGGGVPKPNFRFGYAFRPVFDEFAFSNPTIALDINGINDSNLTFFNKIHIGGEVDIIKWISIRAGFYQGYPTYGLGLPLGPIKLEFASYGVELGKYPGQIEERNYVGTLAIRF